MIILGIETSCDETAISLIEASGELTNPQFKLLAQVVSSQTAVHAEWGGVVPSLAKREHAKNIISVLTECLKLAKLATEEKPNLSAEKLEEIKQLLVRESDLTKNFIAFIQTTPIPKIDSIAVTYGPGLEPALWVGINFAKALALTWNKPVIPVNHMAGHIASVLIDNQAVDFPAIALLVSGGHTELALVHSWSKYELVGQTRDDAVGEAFDKVARLLGLPYPGGPALSALAKQAPPEKLFSLPRPMLHSSDLDFSFSGLKTAVFYLVKDKILTDKEKSALALEFETAVIEVLITKTFKAVEKYDARTIIAGGGVIANLKLRQVLTTKITTDYPTTRLLMPPLELATDNATMIAMAGYLHLINNPPNFDLEKIEAKGNLTF